MKLVPRKYPTENVVVFMTTAKNVTNEKLWKEHKEPFKENRTTWMQWPQNRIYWLIRRYYDNISNDDISKNWRTSKYWTTLSHNDLT
jgi:hypothetical protein